MAPTPTSKFTKTYFEIIDDDIIHCIYALLNNESLGRLSVSNKPIRNMLLDLLEERMIHFVKKQLLEAVPFRKTVQSFFWRDLRDVHDDIRVETPHDGFWRRDDARWQSDRKGFSLQTVDTHSGTTKACVTSTIGLSFYNFRSFKKGRWCQADPGSRADFPGNEEEWHEHVCKCTESRYYKIEYGIGMSYHVSLNGFIFTEPEDLGLKPLAKVLNIEEYLLQDKRNIDIVYECDPSLDWTFPKTGYVHSLSSMHIPGIPERQTTSSVIVAAGTTLFITFHTEFGKVTTSTYVCNDLRHSEDFKAILRHNLGVDGPAMTTQQQHSTKYLNEGGSHDRKGRPQFFLGIEFEPRSRPKPM